VRPHFQLDHENAPAVAELCARVGGLPLALELLALRLNLFSPDALAGTLRRSDAAYSQLLRGGPRDLLDHQRSLDLSMRWSHALLSDEEQTVFRRLAVFTGTFSVDAAAAVASEDPAFLDVVDALVGKSLIAPIAVAGEPRLTIFEPLRRFARLELRASGEWDACHRRHADFYAALLDRDDWPAIPDLDAHLRTIDREWPNLQAILAWSREHDVPAALRLLASIWRYWQHTSRFAEGRAALDAVSDVARPPAASFDITTLRWYTRSLLGAGLLAWFQDDFDASRVLLEECLDAAGRCGDDESRAHCLFALGITGYLQGESSAEGMVQESIQQFRALGRGPGLAEALNSLGYMAIARGNLAQAQAALEEARALYESIGDAFAIARCSRNLGRLAYRNGDLDGATRLLEASIRQFRTGRDRRALAVALNLLGEVHHHRGNLDQAARLYEESLAISRELGTLLACAITLDNLGLVARQRGQLDLARRLIEESLEYSRPRRTQHIIALLLHDLAGVKLEQGHVTEALADSRESMVLMTEYHVPAADQPARRKGIASALNRLSKREQTVLSLVVAGKSNAEIAAVLTISPNTATSHISHILSKLGLSNRTEAAIYAVRHGLVQGPP
jgi:predicted ATPase/DNA-binding CsgD family transcriptional regulator